jgi:hypothetical protein
MVDLTPVALELALRQHGAITTRQLSDAGIGRRAALRLENDTVLRRVHKWVFVLAGAPRTLEQRCAEICLAHPSVFVTGATAGRLMGLRRLPQTAPITISASHPLHIEHPGVLLRRTTKLVRTDIVTRSDGICIASPARLAFDLAATLDDRAYRSVIEQLLHESLVTTEELAVIGHRLLHPARRGSRRFAETMAMRFGAALESDPEIVVADALHEAGVPVVAQETWLDLPNGRRARLDLSVPELKWGIEIDVHPDHLGIEGTASDKQRDRQCHLIGWQIERVSPLDLLDLDRTVGELAALYRARLAHAA